MFHIKLERYIDAGIDDYASVDSVFNAHLIFQYSFDHHTFPPPQIETKDALYFFKRQSNKFKKSFDLPAPPPPPSKRNKVQKMFLLAPFIMFIRKRHTTQIWISVSMSDTVTLFQNYIYTVLSTT